MSSQKVTKLSWTNCFPCLVFVLVRNYLRHSVYDEEKLIWFVILEVQRHAWHWHLHCSGKTLWEGVWRKNQRKWITNKETRGLWRGASSDFFFLNHLLKCLLGSHKEHPNPFGECDFSLNSKSHTTLSPRDMTFTTGDLGETTSQPLSQLWLK